MTKMSDTTPNEDRNGICVLIMGKITLEITHMDINLFLTGIMRFRVNTCDDALFLTDYHT